MIVRINQIDNVMKLQDIIQYTGFMRYGGIFVFSWPNLIPSLLKDNKINKRRERLICFSTN